MENKVRSTLLRVPSMHRRVRVLPPPKPLNETRRVLPPRRRMFAASLQ